MQRLFFMVISVLSPGLYITYSANIHFNGLIKLHRKRGLLLYLLLKYLFGWFKLLVNCSLCQLTSTSNVRAISQKFVCENYKKKFNHRLKLSHEQTAYRYHFLLFPIELSIGKTYLKLVKSESIS